MCGEGNPFESMGTLGRGQGRVGRGDGNSMGSLATWKKGREELCGVLVTLGGPWVPGGEEREELSGVIGTLWDPWGSRGEEAGKGCVW